MFSKTSVEDDMSLGSIEVRQVAVDSFIYNILPKKTTSSSAYDVRGMAGSLSVTTPWKEV